MTIVLPAYPIPTEKPPDYTSAPLEDERTLAHNPRPGARNQLGHYVKSWKQATLILKSQDESSELPVYSHGGTVQGEIGLACAENIIEICVKLSGHLNLMVADCGSTGAVLISDTRVLWTQDDAKERCPSILPFSIQFPHTFVDPNGKAWKLPPSFQSTSSGVPALFSKVVYSLTVTITKTRRYALASWTSSRMFSAMLDYRPRTRPHRPVVMVDSIFASIKPVPEEWVQHILTLEPRLGTNERAVECHLLIPSVHTYSISDTIPFHIQLRGPLGSLHEVVPPNSRLLDPAIAEDAELKESLDLSPEGPHAIRVYIARQIHVEVNGRRRYRTYTVGTSQMWPVPPIISQDGEYSSADDELCVDWQGQLKCRPEVICASFCAGMLAVKDFIVIGLVPSYVRPSFLLPVQLACPISEKTKCSVGDSIKAQQSGLSHPTTQGSLVSSADAKRAAHRQSWRFEPIREEPVFESPHIDLEQFKRHHKPCSPLPRTSSAPQLISTTTTSPIYIHHLDKMSSNSLMPRTDSFNARVRGTSHIDFKTATTGVAAKSMRNEISRLVSTVEDPSTKRAFDTEMQSFFYLFTRYLAERAKSVELDWERIKSPDADKVVAYADLAPATDPKNLSKLAVLKVNGGLGTSMGMTGAKSALEVKEDMTFLDLTVRQIEHLNTTSRVDVPLILMTSFNTHEDTLRIIKKYANQQLRITTFNQSRYPRIYKESLLPCPKRADDDKSHWYPPGHGDLYNALLHSGVLDQLLAEGKEYLFVSNSDNLGAVVDEKILQHMIQTKAEFLMEVTDKTKADVKGGTIIDYEGSIRLLEIAQVPSEHAEDFKSVRKFKIFNTNNLWINLKALKRIMDTEGLELDIIINPKITDDGHAVIQLETAAGAAIKHFKNAHGVNVPRSRFLPVKSCSDLLLIKSDIYSLQHGQLVINPQRMFETTPVIKLGDHFKKIQQFQKRFKKIPKILELDHLTVTGDVYFGRNVTLRGTVIVVANEGQRIDIPDGCILENRLLSGNLNMIEL